jgi:hypothetical protein
MEGSGIIAPRRSNSAIFIGRGAPLYAIVAKSEAKSWLAEFADPE